MTTQIVGTCGNCGGPVEVPTVWHGIYPPAPACRHCGATAKQDFGPRMPMNPSPRDGGFVDIDVRTDGTHWKRT